jgi:hypothetical protein
MYKYTSELRADELATGVQEGAAVKAYNCAGFDDASLNCSS